MSDHTKALADMFEFNSTMTSVGLGDLKNDDAVHRVRNGEGSSMSFLTGHMLSSRYGILKMLGETKENPYAELFGGSAEAQDGSAYPDVSELKDGWDDLSERFVATLRGLADDQALAPAPDGFPIQDKTMRGAIMFLAWHESYHVGQLGLMRTEMGYQSLQHALYATMEK